MTTPDNETHELHYFTTTDKKVWVICAQLLNHIQIEAKRANIAELSDALMLIMGDLAMQQISIGSFYLLSIKNTIQYLKERSRTLVNDQEKTLITDTCELLIKLELRGLPSYGRQN